MSQSPPDGPSDAEQVRARRVSLEREVRRRTARFVESWPAERVEALVEAIIAVTLKYEQRGSSFRTQREQRQR